MLLDDFSLLEPIGEGAFGKVYLISKQGIKRNLLLKK